MNNDDKPLKKNINMHINGDFALQKKNQRTYCKLNPVFPNINSNLPFENIRISKSEMSRI